MPRPRPSVSDRLRAWRRRLAALLRRRETDRALSAELAFHLDMETEKNIRAGHDPAEALRLARLSFGGVGRVVEEVRDTRNLGWLEDLQHDLRYAMRGFRRSPGFAAAAVGTLALGIGATTAVFSVVHGVVMAPLRYADADRLVRVWESNPAQGIERGTVAPGTYVDLSKRARLLERFALFGERTFLLTSGDVTWESHAAAVSPGLFEMLGARPVVGRTFPLEDSTGKSSGSLDEDEVVLSHGLWQRRFGGDRNVVGRTVRMDGRWTYTIVGVMPPGFAFPLHAEVWVPLPYASSVTAAERQYRFYSAIAKLAPGRTLQQASLEADGIAAQLAAEYPASNAGWSIRMELLDRSILGTARRALLLLLALAACVLLIACGNVASLLVARAAARRHELALRAALGAGTRRLVRQWAAESLLLALLGGVGGLAAGWWVSRLLLAVAPADIPRLDEVAFRGPEFVFAVFVTGAVALLVGIAPALRSGDAGLIDSLRGRNPADARGRTAREWLVGAQVALTVVLTVAAALLVRSFDQLQRADLGFSHHEVVAAELRVPSGRFGGSSAHESWFRRAQYYDRLLAELTRLPGVRSVAGTTNIPLTGEMGYGSMWRAAPRARGHEPPVSAADQWNAVIQVVTPRYFETLGITLLRGRTFRDEDRFTLEQLARPDALLPDGVAIVNEAMAKHFWPSGDPLGTSLTLATDTRIASSRTIVGVVGSVRAASVDAEATPTIFLPFGQSPGRSLSLVLRGNLAPEKLVKLVADRLRTFDPELAVRAVQPLDAIVGRAVSRPRFTMLLAGSFAGLALAIAGVGVSGIVAFLVTRRRQEIGIRMALGARPRSVLWLVLREGLRPVLFGMIAGSLGAVLVAIGMRALLYGVAALDAASFAVAFALLLSAAVAAAALPARRAVRADPLQALRSE